ncbi:DUF2877 domain-containing protein [Bacillus haynesii]|uniref:DUF2877 domain-containing protein n=1 Tax=Bacillus haynesii TaxID=1925021 RepID=UPI00227DE09A|nr:DUF2877 domain-containing protein [Bacillus haynesii]MCY7816380.1 DUF2877 domain-containing protein [Bacillus haynesii]MCY8660898.1 DUF2877 domain-containing protein [Bacillus haynesii]MEC1344479.1 DUF2877 domain-containing protein [Bacillus haynesii]MEC1475509.1 DUF2877 domain-containing protein [Bacillus haynesii]
MILQASAIGSIALQLLTEGKTFTVHSIFEKGLNIVDRNDELIFIGTKENGTFPFGILLDSQTKQTLKAGLEAGDTFHVRNNHLSHNCFELNFNAKILPLYTDFKHANINKLKENVKQISFKSYESTDFESAHVSDLINKLHDPTKDLEEEFRYFIGRGQGLTPTGDDILVGILYGHFINSFIAQKHLETLGNLIRKPLTTVVSTRFLTCAIEGLFSSKITRLQHDSSLKSMKSLIKVGSSSGMDTLYGIYMALTKE